MLAIDDKDLGTPASLSNKLVTLEIDGHHVSVPEGTSVLRAAATGRRCDSETVRDRFDGGIRLLPRCA